VADCIFCSIIAGDMEADVVYKDEQVVAFRDINPQAPVHLLIVPRKHIPHLTQLEQKDNELIGHIFQVANDLAAKESLAERGFRVVANCKDEGGQSVDHIHFHLLGGRQLDWPPG